MKLSKIVEASSRHQKIETLSDPILYDSLQLPPPGFDWNLFLSIAAIAMVFFVAVVGVITFLRRDKRSRAKQKEIKLENGDLRTDTFNTKRENKRLRSDIKNLKRRMAELITTVEALKGGAEVSC